MIRLKNLIMEREDSKRKNIKMRVNYIVYDTNYRDSTMPIHDEMMSKEFAKEMVDQIVDMIEDENIRNPETGEYEYDVTRLDSDIRFDCCIQKDDYEIDFNVSYDEDAELVAIDIQDPELADKFGITESDLYELLS
jgi:hypothetical protein|tara:strand:+ start:828 stop:1235 length:408 start_codon:yes stop_codon:yes gene_type:complete